MENCFTLLQSTTAPSFGFINNLSQKVVQNAEEFVKSTKSESAIKDLTMLASLNSLAVELNIQFHLLAVMFTQMPEACIETIDKIGLMQNTFQLLESAENLLPHISSQSILQWVCPVLLLIEQLEQYLAVQKVRKQILATYPDRNWKIWLNNKWKNFNAEINHKVDQAYSNGEPFCSYTFNSLSYVVHFGTMTCYNQLLSTSTPINLVQRNKFSTDFFWDINQKISTFDFLNNLPNVQNKGQVKKPIQMESYIEHRVKWFLELLVTFLKQKNIDSETLQAIVRLVMRLTRNHSNACLFAQLGGIHELLNLNENLNFVGIIPMTTIIIRHVFEDENVLKYIMKNNLNWEVSTTNIYLLEQQHVFRRLTSAGIRDAKVFANAAKESLQIPINSDKEIFKINETQLPNELKEMCKQSQDLTKTLLDLLPSRYSNQFGDTDNKSYIFKTSNLLHILAEMCRFCDPTVKVILEHQYIAGKSIFYLVFVSYLMPLPLFR